MAIQIHTTRLPAIREQDPLKQGLKHKFLIDPAILLSIREQDPLKQGLKPYVWSTSGNL